MKGINSEVIEKLMEAKRLEKEALMMLLPEKMQGHLEVISNEVKAMVFDYIEDFNKKQEDESCHDRAYKKNSNTSKVKKVDIG